MGYLSNHVPLRIEWQLATPWVPAPAGMHLDGLVAWAIVRRALAGQTPPEDGSIYDDLIRDLPFDKSADGASSERWVWKASLLQAEVIGSERRYLTAKTPTLAIAEYTASGVLSTKGGSKVDTVRGYYKAAALHYPLEHVRKVVAWCVGDPDRLADLLGDVDALGAKTRLGHGAVKEVNGALFTMVEDERALENWKYRVMHTPEPGFVPTVSPLRTPYWRADRRVAAWRPLG